MTWVATNLLCGFSSDLLGGARSRPAAHEAVLFHGVDSVLYVLAAVQAALIESR